MQRKKTGRTLVNVPIRRPKVESDVGKLGLVLVFGLGGLMAVVFGFQVLVCHFEHPGCSVRQCIKNEFPKKEGGRSPRS